MFHWFIVLFKHILCATNNFSTIDNNFEIQQKTYQ